MLQNCYWTFGRLELNTYLGLDQRVFYCIFYELELVGHLQEHLKLSVFAEIPPKALSNSFDYPYSCPGLHWLSCQSTVHHQAGGTCTLFVASSVRNAYSS